MRRLALLCLTIFIVAGAGCRKEQAPVPAAQPAKQASAAPQAAKPTAPANAPQAPGAAADKTPGEKPKEITEEEGDLESTEDAAKPTTQPSFKLAVAAPPAKPSHFREGAQYLRLLVSQPTTVAPDQVEVLEVFAYGSAPSLALEQKLDAWTQHGKPSYVAVTRLPAMTDDAKRLQARVYYSLLAINKADLHSVLMRDTQTRTDLLSSPDKIFATMREHGVALDQFKQAFESQGVEDSLARAEFANRRYRVDGLPLIAINGKYLTDPNRAGGDAELLQLIKELAAIEHGD